MAVDLDAIETALAKMTPGPWHNYFERVIADCYEVATCHAKRPQEVYDAAGIVLLRNHGDAMAAEIRTLRADLAAARRSAWLLMWQAIGAAVSEDHALNVAIDTLERLKRPRNVCAHCQAEHDVPSGAMAAHVRECEQNPMAVELRAARLVAANARSVAVEAIGLADAISDHAEDGLYDNRIDALRTRLASPADFAARVTAALDRYGKAAFELGLGRNDGAGLVDAARAEVDAAIGVEVAK